MPCLSLHKNVALKIDLVLSLCPFCCSFSFFPRHDFSHGSYSTEAILPSCRCQHSFWSSEKNTTVNYNSISWAALEEPIKYFQSRSLRAGLEPARGNACFESNASTTRPSQLLVCQNSLITCLKTVIIEFVELAAP